MADLVIAQDQAGTGNVKPVFVVTEATGRVYTATAAPVATGDDNNMMALLAELLAGVGLMAVAVKMKKEV